MNLSQDSLTIIWSADFVLEIKLIPYGKKRKAEEVQIENCI